MVKNLNFVIDLSIVYDYEALSARCKTWELDK
jgi:hypothetical protein